MTITLLFAILATLNAIIGVTGLIVRKHRNEARRNLSKIQEKVTQTELQSNSDRVR